MKAVLIRKIQTQKHLGLHKRKYYLLTPLVIIIVFMTIFSFYFDKLHVMQELVVRVIKCIVLLRGILQRDQYMSRYDTQNYRSVNKKLSKVSMA